MNQEKHWNTIASHYEDEIFDVFKNDKREILPVYFRKHGNLNHRAIDFGCGVGKAFSYLAPLFKEIVAVDISEEILTIAKKLPFSNISLQQMDLTTGNFKNTPAEFAFCCNVIMLPEVDKNEVMIRNIQLSLKKGGTALIVIPSLESIFYSSWRLIQMYKKGGTVISDIPASEFDYFKANKIDLIQGIMHINGVPTKHYSQPEMEVLFAEAGFTITALEKIEYDWNTELESPPTWMKEPYPWDWLVECRKKG